MIRRPSSALPLIVRAALTTLAALAALVLAPAAQAQNQPYYLGLSQTLSHESNLYRIGDSQVLPAGLSRADLVSSTALFAGVDQTFGRQRVYGSAALRANRFQDNTGLNNESYTLNAALDWATVERLSGTLSLAASQNLTQFNELNTLGAVQTQRNIERNQQLDAKVRLGVVTRYTAEATLGLRQRRFSALSYARSEFDQHSGSIGLRYRPSNLLQLGVAARLTQADYPRFRNLGGGVYESDRLQRTDIDFTGFWQPSGNSTLNARISPTRSRYDRNVDADFSGITGSANWVWQATGKVKLSSLLSHDTGQSYDAINQGILGVGTVDYSRSTTALKLQADYEFSAKIGLTASLTQARRLLARNFNLNGTGVAERGADTGSTLGLGAKWSPTRAIQVGCDLSAEQRSSNNQALATTQSANTFGCYGQFVLQ